MLLSNKKTNKTKQNTNEAKPLVIKIYYDFILVFIQLFMFFLPVIVTLSCGQAGQTGNGNS